MQQELKHLSFSSIALLAQNQLRWYRKYILGIEEVYDEIRALIVGSAVHKVIEGYNKTGKIDFAPGQNMILYSKLSNDEIDKGYFEFTFACDNFFSTNPKQIEGEKAFLLDLWHSIKFKWFIDGYDEEENILYDYKVVSNFLDIDNDFNKLYNKYKWQARFYSLAMEVGFGKRVDTVIFKEISKKDSVIKAGSKIKKADIISLCDSFAEWDDKLTIPKIVEKYCPKKPATKDIIITLTDEDRERARDLFARAIRNIAMVSAVGDENLLSPIGEME